MKYLVAVFNHRRHRAVFIEYIVSVCHKKGHKAAPAVELAHALHLVCQPVKCALFGARRATVSTRALMSARLPCR